MFKLHLTKVIHFIGKSGLTKIFHIKSPASSEAELEN